MPNNKFRTPLLQSAAILGAVIILVLIVGSSGSSSGGGALALFAGIGNAIVFAIGMAFAIAFSIAVLIGIFLAAVAAVDKNAAIAMYDGLKKKFASSLLALSSSFGGDAAARGITEEEYESMQEELSQVQKESSQLQQKVDTVSSSNTELQANISSLASSNKTLKAQIDELSTTVLGLQESTAKTNELVFQLSKKIEEDDDQQSNDQMTQLEQLQTETKEKVEAIGVRLAEVESNFKQAPTAGIFSYIEKESDQALFIEKIEEALILEMTYAQIDEHLTENLPAALDKIIKDHPSLTKNYIRNVRKD